MRLADWPERLHGYLASQSAQPFVWGESDCVLFALGAMEAMTGEDVSAEFRGRYHTALGAGRLLKRYGGGGIKEGMERFAGERGMEQSPLAFAQRGDLVLLREDGRNALGIALGQMLVSKGQIGLRYGMLKDFGVAAWRV